MLKSQGKLGFFVDGVQFYIKKALIGGSIKKCGVSRYAFTNPKTLQNVGWHGGEEEI